MLRRTAPSGAIFMVLLALSALPEARACEPDTVGAPLALSNTSGGIFLGEAMGQTFYAPETLITSITVWRVAEQDVNQFGVKLYVVNVDDQGNPNVGDYVLENGPTVVVYLGDGIHPTPIRFEFDPPLALPAPGMYHLAFQSDPCNGFWNLRASEPSTYEQGCIWLHDRSPIAGCPLRRFPRKFPNADLTFEVVFCDTATPAGNESWGAVKARYR